MDELNRVATYSMIGIVAVFFAVMIALPTFGITGEATKTSLFRGVAITTGECTSLKDTCAQGSFCSSNLMVSPGSKLKGIYRGPCIKKYPQGRLCKKNYQCASNNCVGADELSKRKFIGPQTGGCA